MKWYITVDGGTTNTRMYLMEASKKPVAVDSVKLAMGANACKEDPDGFRCSVKQGIADLLLRNRKTEADITKILASGMITSELGLYPLSHLSVPAGIGELHDGMKETVLSEITSVPFVFIPGVKTMCQTLETADMMRGEETELMGIEPRGRCVYVFPGSHSKMIDTDEQHRIVNFSTMLTGEMIASLAQHTILKNAVDLTLTSVNRDFLLKGFQYCRERGMNEALFKVRILKNIFQCSESEAYSFFLGCVLCPEIECLEKSSAPAVVIGGKSQIRQAMTVLLKQISEKEIICLSDEEVDASTSLGMIRIYEYEGKEPKRC